jgi:hypothetical protein
MHLVSPRYLAGPGDGLGTVAAVLLATGWQPFNDDKWTNSYLAPARRHVITMGPQHRIMGDLCIWGLDGTAGRARWHAGFTRTCPPEIIIETLQGHFLTSPHALDHEFSELKPLADAGWKRTDLGSRVMYESPGGAAVRRNHDGWVAVASCPVHNGLLWTADFSAAAPARLIAEFCAALTNPAPVRRRPNHVPEAARPYLQLA